MRNKNSSEHRRKVNFGGIKLKVCMTKVRKFAEITPNLPFSEFNFYKLYRETFEKSELGRMKKLLHLREMAEIFGLVRKSMMPKRVMRVMPEMPTVRCAQVMTSRHPLSRKASERRRNGKRTL